MCFLASESGILNVSWVLSAMINNGVAACLLNETFFFTLRFFAMSGSEGLCNDVRYEARGRSISPRLLWTTIGSWGNKARS